MREYNLMRRLLPHLPTAAAVLVVLVLYAFFGSVGTFSFRRTSWERTPDVGFTERYYAALAEGFLRGRLDMPYVPDGRWKDVNPYDQSSRAKQGLEWEMWDASLYAGRFYLYFSPVPVLLVYIPFRIVAGAYPPDALVATLMSAWAFLMCVAFARRALAGRRLHVPFPIWVLLIGVANVVPYMLTHVRAYEVAIATGMALTSSFAYALLRWSESGAVRHAVWMSVWLALAIVTRPNLIVLVLVLAYVLVRGGRASRPLAAGILPDADSSNAAGQDARQKRARRPPPIAAAAIPLILVAIAVAIYNYLRFGNPLELGMTYQISYVPMWRVPPCSLCDFPDAVRFVNTIGHYLFWSPAYASEFPFLDLQRNVLDPAASFAGGAEQVGGVVALNPLTMIGSAAALILALRRDGGDAGLRAAIRVCAAAWLILLTLSTCRWVTARYALDFMLLLTTASVVCIEHVLSFLESLEIRVKILSVITTIAACFAIVVGVLLGFRGPEGAFERKNPAALEILRPQGKNDVP